MSYITDALGAGGYISKHLPGFQERSQQLQYAEAVSTALFCDEPLLVEGPTGSGKGLGYLVPAIRYATQERRQVVIVTANITLQEQLINRDLPLLREALPWGFEFALRKGVSNYLCRLRRSTGEQPAKLSDEQKHQYRETLKWSHSTRTGDRSDLYFEPDPLVWSCFSTTPDGCLRRKCVVYDECFVTRAFKEAREAQIIVTNYHVLFSHFVVREEAGTDIVLPPYSALVLDEGHRAADIARDFFGFQVSRHRCLLAISDLRDKSKSGFSGSRFYTGLRGTIEKFFDHLREVQKSETYKVCLTEPWQVDADDLILGMTAAAARYRDYLDTHALAPEDEQRTSSLMGRCLGIAAELAETEKLVDDNRVYSIEQGGRSAPYVQCRTIDVSHDLGVRIFSQTPATVVTSATLQVDGSFDLIFDELGVPDTGAHGDVGSPFDFRTQALLVTGDWMPDPNSEPFAEEVTRSLRYIIQVVRGRTLALFTSYRVLKYVREHLGDVGYTIYAQGEAPRSALIEHFRNEVESCLLATESFWSGVDVPGESLSCVVIDRLPFSSPGDPVAHVLSDRHGRAHFWNWVLPRAVLSLKQGFGRLIRSVDDRGAVVVLDSRMMGRGYTQDFMRSLPPVPQVATLEALEAFFERG